MNKSLFRLYLLVIILLLSGVSLVAQENEAEAKTVELLQANTLEFDEASGNEARRAVGKVVFKHDDVYMYCDSAWFFYDLNIVYAYDNVRIKEGDSILLVSKFLEYDGNLRLAKMRDSVIIKHNNSILVTDSINFERNLNLISYFNEGKIYDNDNDIRLVSDRGYYYISDKDFYAIKDVKLRSSDYIISSDTLKYNTESAIAKFYGPTHVVADSNVLYCEKGYYDTRENIASFSRNSWLRSKSNYLHGDSLYYDRKILYGEAFGNVSLIDTVENIKASGEYAYYFEQPERSLLTKNLLLEYLVDNDTLFLHSDTITTNVDTLGNKSINAFRNVQIYKSDMQARCDSLSFYSLDSIVRMYYEPILWAENSQLTTDYLQVYIKEKESYDIELQGDVLAIQNNDSIRYNQVRSKKMLGFVEDNKLKQLRFNDNCQSIYFMLDEDTNRPKYLHKLICNFIVADFDDDQISSISTYQNPDCQIIPIDQVNEESSFLDNFIWLDYLRPKSKEEIFNWKEKKLF